MVKRALRFATAAMNRLGIFNKVFAVDSEQIAALKCATRFNNGGKATVRQLLWAKQGCVLRWRLGIEAVKTIVILQVSAVGIDGVKAEVIAAGQIPTGEKNAAVIQHAGLQVVALVISNLLDICAIVIHHMQDKR